MEAFLEETVRQYTTDPLALVVYTDVARGQVVCFVAAKVLLDKGIEGTCVPGTDIPIIRRQHVSFGSSDQAVFTINMLQWKHIQTIFGGHA